MLSHPLHGMHVDLYHLSNSKSLVINTVYASFIAGCRIGLM
jgi:hypothetical protein